MKKLEPCICGGSVKLEEYSSFGLVNKKPIFVIWRIKCHSCGVEVLLGDKSELRKIWNAWNTRKSLAALEAMKEAE